MVWLRRFSIPALAVLLMSAAGFSGVSGLKSVPVRAQGVVETHVGKFDTFDAFIGISSDGTDVAAYACDGANDGIADDFKGKVSDAVNGVLALQSETGDVLTLNIDQGIQTDGALTGTLTTADQNVDTFSADAAVLPGAFYRASDTFADGTAAEGGWVVLNSGDVRGRLNLNNDLLTATFAAPGRPMPAVFGLTANGQTLQQAPGMLQNQFVPLQQALQQQNVVLVTNFRLVTPTTVLFPFTVPTLNGLLGTQQLNIARATFTNPFFMQFLR